MSTCSNHREEPVSITVTGWIVVQCRVCGAGNVLAPPEGMCGYPGCTTDHRETSTDRAE